VPTPSLNAFEATLPRLVFDPSDNDAAASSAYPKLIDRVGWFSGTFTIVLIAWLHTGGTKYHPCYVNGR